MLSAAEVPNLRARVLDAGQNVALSQTACAEGRIAHGASVRSR